MRNFRYIQDIVTLKLEKHICIGCGRCLEVCPHQVFALRDNKADIVTGYACMECGACSRNCPVSAISVDAGVGCATGLINEWLMERNIRRGKGSNCCS